MSIAVSAATSQLGKLVLEGLLAKNLSSPIVAAARNPDKINADGVEKRKLDYSDVATIAPALAGVKTLVLISSGSFDPPRAQQHKNVIDGAKAAGVQLILYTSITKATTSAALIAADHKTTEDYLEASGIPYVAVRNGWYIENWAGSLPGVVASGKIFNSTHGAKLTPASRRDYGEAAANLAARAHSGEAIKKVWELGGAPVTLDDFAAVIGKAAGKQIEHVDLPVEKYKELLVSYGVPDGFAFVMSQIYDLAPQGSLFTDSGDLEAALGHAPEDFAEVLTKLVLSPPAPSAH